MLFCLSLSDRTTQISNILCASASLREKSTDEFRIKIETGYAVDSTVYKMLDHAGRAQTLAAPQSQQNEIFVEI